MSSEVEEKQRAEGELDWGDKRRRRGSVIPRCEFIDLSKTLERKMRRERRQDEGTAVAAAAQFAHAGAVFAESPLLLAKN